MLGRRLGFVALPITCLILRMLIRVSSDSMMSTLPPNDVDPAYVDRLQHGILLRSVSQMLFLCCLFSPAYVQQRSLLKILLHFLCTFELILHVWFRC